MLSQKQILFGNKMLQEVAISWDVPILKAARILAGKEINEFWKWINADEFLNYQLNETQDTFKEEKKQYAEDCKVYEKPWELWQSALVMPGSLNWIDLYREPNWSEHCVYRRKQTTFMPEYYSGLNWRDAEHLIGKTIECTNNPDEVWKVRRLGKIVPTGKNFYVDCASFFTYIRTCEKTFKHPTINICGVELPMPETVAPEPGTVYWVFRNTATDRDGSLYYSGIWSKYVSKWEEESLKNGAIHLTEERAKAWADWWKTAVIDKMK